MRRGCTLTIASGLLLAQCASKPPEVKPAVGSPAPYQSYTCAQLDQESAALTAKAAELSATRQQNRVKWAVPFLGADGQTTTTRLAQIEGQLAGIELARKQKTCR